MPGIHLGSNHPLRVQNAYIFWLGLLDWALKNQLLIESAWYADRRPFEDLVENCVMFCFSKETRIETRIIYVYWDSLLRFASALWTIRWSSQVNKNNICLMLLKRLSLQIIFNDQHMKERLCMTHNNISYWCWSKAVRRFHNPFNFWRFLLLENLTYNTKKHVVNWDMQFSANMLEKYLAESYSPYLKKWTLFILFWCVGALRFQKQLI